MKVGYVTLLHPWTTVNGVPCNCHLVNHLVGVAEIAQRIDYTRQGVHKLVRRPDFPKPVAKLSAGFVWERAAVEHWLREHHFTDNL